MPEQRTHHDEARFWLDEAAAGLRVQLRAGVLLNAAFVEAAAAIGTGYAHLAAIEQAVEFRAASATAEASMIEAYQTTGLLARRHLDAIDDALVRREAQAAEEARPHDGEPTGAGSCEFVLDGKRCVFGHGHGAGYHHLEDGTDIEAGRG